MTSERNKAPSPTNKDVIVEANENSITQSCKNNSNDNTRKVSADNATFQKSKQKIELTSTLNNCSNDSQASREKVEISNEDIEDNIAKNKGTVMSDSQEHIDLCNAENLKTVSKREMMSQENNLTLDNHEKEEEKLKDTFDIISERNKLVSHSIRLSETFHSNKKLQDENMESKVFPHLKSMSLLDMTELDSLNTIATRKLEKTRSKEKIASCSFDKNDDTKRNRRTSQNIERKSSSFLKRDSCTLPDNDDDDKTFSEFILSIADIPYTSKPRALSYEPENSERLDPVSVSKNEKVISHKSTASLKPPAENEPSSNSESTICVRRRMDIRKEYRIALAKLTQRRDLNSKLQFELATYYRRKQEAVGQSIVSGTTDKLEFEVRAVKLKTSIKDLRNSKETLADHYTKTNKHLSNEADAKLVKVSNIWNEFVTSRRKVILKAQGRTKGKQIPLSFWEDLEKKEAAKEKEISKIRLKYIAHLNEVKRQNRILNEQQTLSNGLRTIDFEQLKIENATLGSQFELRNKEVQRLREKNSSALITIAHLREKVNNFILKRPFEKESLANANRKLNEVRANLNSLKAGREKLRRDNNVLRRQTGLLGRDILLRHFEDVVDNVHNNKNSIMRNIKSWKSYSKEISTLKENLKSSKID